MAENGLISLPLHLHAHLRTSETGSPCNAHAQIYDKLMRVRCLFGTAMSEAALKACATSGSIGDTDISLELELPSVHHCGYRGLSQLRVCCPVSCMQQSCAGQPREACTLQSELSPSADMRQGMAASKHCLSAACCKHA